MSKDGDMLFLGHILVVLFILEIRKVQCEVQSHPPGLPGTNIQADLAGPEPSTPTHHEDADPCPAGLPRNKFLQVHQGVCYQFLLDDSEKQTFPEAEKFCQVQKGSLVMVKSQEVNDYITQQLNLLGMNLDIWIGLYQNAGGKFVWVDGSVPVYTNWWGAGYHGYHGDVEQNNMCVMLDTGRLGHWIDNECSVYAEHFVCQYH